MLTMTKLEKIEEILREYENGLDSALDALDILEGIKTVIDAPDISYDIEVKADSPAGELIAYAGHDPENPSVGIYFAPKGGDGAICDLALAEVKGKELADIAKEQGEDIGLKDISLYTYADPYTEDYTHKNIIKRKDVEEALGLEKQKESKEGIVR